MPPFAESEWRDCHAVNAAGGVEMLEWQDIVMEGWLGRNRFGRWSAPTCAGSVPRQNGKTVGLVQSRANYGMVVLKEEVIYTSHLQKTSTETFEGMAAFFDTKALRKYVKDIKTALGREQIILKNGARIKFLARTRNGGRGQHGDLLIFDEALELDADSQASFLPAISASRNPQAIYVSTPPTPKSDGLVFRGIRRRALSGDSESTAWFEWSVDEVGDVRDRSRWYAANPSLGWLIQESTIEGEVEQMDPDVFARERLGWFPEAQAAEAPISAEKWAACRVGKEDIPRDGVIAHAVKFAPDGSSASIAICCKPDEGAPYIQCIDNRSMGGGLRWITEWLAPREDDAAVLAVDGRAYSGALLAALDDAGYAPVQIVTPKTADVAAACSMLVEAVDAGELAHGGQSGLDSSALNVRRRAIGADGGFGFKGEGEIDATPIEACALALWAARTTRRDQRRTERLL